MDTIVSVEIVDELPDLEETANRALDWFLRVEECCTRFNPESELMRLCARPSIAVPASEILFEAIRFALAVADETDGAFDPTVGMAMQLRGYDREYRTGKVVQANVDAEVSLASYRDVVCDAGARTITLLRPLLLDLGAVAKGLAIDIAARELRPAKNFAIDAGGDLFLAGHNVKGEAWAVGIRHPIGEQELLRFLRVSDMAVCTSGVDTRGKHILDARNSRPAEAAASATVIARTAMMADALATAAFVLGPVEGIELLNRLEVRGVIVTPACDIYETKTFA
jgi:thiamine biosynthesis lipoprotein